MLSPEIIRTLAVDQPQPGRPPYMISASGLVKIGQWLYVIPDDDLFIGVFDLENGAPGRLLRILPGELPLEFLPRKELKPDFEALLYIPVELGLGSVGLLAVPSLSRQNRSTGVFIPLKADGQIDQSAITPLDFEHLYNLLLRAIPQLNIEGACLLDDQLYLFHRGSPGKIIRLKASTLSQIKSGESNFALLDINDYQLGRIKGVPLRFTDCTSVGGNVLFLAAAEDTDDPFLDGTFKGAAIGALNREGKLLFCQKIACQCKPEGICAQLHGDKLEILLVTDSDSVKVASTLLKLDMDVKEIRGAVFEG